MKKLITFFEAKTVLRKLNTPSNRKLMLPKDRKEIKHLDTLRALTRAQRIFIAKIENSL
tara:strand:+ start:15055 stop:15231 length:177 start_codon:yes stop_codon:yes gene_type:complete